MSIGPRPVWLEEEAEIASLLHAALDRFDRQPGTQRLRPVVLPAERHLPSLARADSQADQSWALVRALEELGLLSVRLRPRNPLDPHWQGATLAFPQQCEPLLREWLGRPPAQRVTQQWREAVQRHAAAFPHGAQILYRRRIDIPGRSADEIVRSLARIGTLGGPLTLRQLSATVFWGDSKVLDERAELLQGLFPGLQIRARALVVAVHLPRSWRGTLFVENQDTYTASAGGVPAETTELAIVYAAGFRGAAERIRSRTGALLHFAGPGAPQRAAAFEDWWFEAGAPAGPCWFWGDLDFAGMQILKALRQRFEGLTAWRPGYEPMVQTLREQGGYRPFAPGEPGQSDPGTTGCPFADADLLPAIRQYGQLDQERVTSPR